MSPSTVTPGRVAAGLFGQPHECWSCVGLLPFADARVPDLGSPSSLWRYGASEAALLRIRWKWRLLRVPKQCQLHDGVVLFYLLQGVWTPGLRLALCSFAGLGHLVGILCRRTKGDMLLAFLEMVCQTSFLAGKVLRPTCLAPS